MKFSVCGHEHLHLHSVFSCLDSPSHPRDVVAYTKRLGNQFTTITDHGHMGAIPELVRACDEHKIEPIFGCEFYVNNLQPTVSSEENYKLFEKDLSPEEKK